MAPLPTAERPPAGLSAYWLGHWRHCLKVLKEQGTWAWEQKPLLDEYVYALIEADRARVGFAWLDHLEEKVAGEEIDFVMLRQIAGALPTQWDRHSKRALILADKLVLTPASRKSLGILEADEGREDPLDALDELATRRSARA